MCKRVFFTALVLVGILVGAKVWHERQKDSSLDGRVQKIERSLNKLEQEDNQEFLNLAREEAKVNNLRKTVTELETATEKQRKMIVLLREQLRTGEAFITVGDDSFSAKRGMEKLEQKFAAYNLNITKLKHMNANLKAQESYFAKLSENIKAKSAKRKEMQTRLIVLKTQLLNLEREKMRRKTTVDKGADQEAKLNQEINELENEIGIHRRALELQEEYRPEQFETSKPVETKKPSILDQVDSHPDFQNRKVVVEDK